MRKTFHHTKTKKSTTKKGTFPNVSDNFSQDTKNAFLQWDSWRIVPLNESGAERLAMTIFDYFSANTEALCFDEFLIDHRLSKNTYYKWVAKFEKVEAAHQQALMILGTRRHKGGLKNELNTVLVKFTMPLFDQEIKDMITFFNDQKKPTEELLAASKIIVNMTKFPESDLVPLKTKDEHD